MADEIQAQMYPFHNGPFHNQHKLVTGEPPRIYFPTGDVYSQLEDAMLVIAFHIYLRQQYRGAGKINTGYVYGGTTPSETVVRVESVAALSAATAAVVLDLPVGETDISSASSVIVARKRRPSVAVTLGK